MYGFISKLEIMEWHVARILKRIYESIACGWSRIHKTEAGLGMAITKYIMDAMEGTIDIQSRQIKVPNFYSCLI